MYKAIIFDLDGTLLDTIDDLGNSANSMLQRYGFPTHPIDLYRTIIGSGMNNLIERSMPPGTSPEIQQEGLALFRNTLYPEHCMDQTVPYEGIPELLATLAARGLPMGVCSNKDDRLTKKLITALFPDIPFRSIIGHRDGIARKPDPAQAFLVADELGVEPKDILYVGDSGVDMRTAHNAGMTPLGVVWGYRSREVLVENRAAGLAETAEDILRFFEKGKSDENG